MTRFVGSRSLTCRTDKKAREEIRQRGAVVPVSYQAFEQVGSAEKRAVSRFRSSQHDVVAATGPRVPAVEHEFFGSKPGQPRLFVEDVCVFDEFAPISRRLQVHFDDTGIRRHLEMLQSRIVWRRVALNLYW